MSGGKRKYIHKGQLKKILYIEYMKHNQQLKIHFLAGKHSM